LSVKTAEIEVSDTPKALGLADMKVFSINAGCRWLRRSWLRVCSVPREDFHGIKMPQA
jgi:hypothetical protein